MSKLVNNEPRKVEKVRWNGWGYADTEFTLQDGYVYLSGSRYLFCIFYLSALFSAGHVMPYIREFVERVMGVPLESIYLVY